MINANELRIGNWLYLSVRDEAFQWDEYDFLEDGSLARPIPLTPKIMRKCGFEKDGCYWRNPDNELFLIEEFEVSFYNSINETIKYLHQLQNSYFAMTYDELIYTP